MNCGNNENKKEKLSWFASMKKNFVNERDEYIKNTSYKRFLYNIEDILIAMFYLFLTFVILFGAFVLYKINFYKNFEKYNNNTLISASAKSLNEISNYDNVTDLTGTTWEFNVALNGLDFNFDDITFISSGETFFGINFYYDLEFDSGFLQYIDIYDNLTIAYDGDWIDLAYRTIKVTGGTDATNTDLIEWLQLNATLQQSGPTQLTTPVLSSTLVVESGVDLYWTYDSSISTPYSFEIYKDNTLLATTNSSFYTITSNGTYKVRQLGDNNLYTDSEFSNSVTISGLTHFSLTLDDGVSSLTTYSLNGTSFVSEPINYSSFYLLLDNNFNTQFYPIIYFSIYNTNDNTINGTKLDNGFVFNSENDISSLSDIEYYSHLDNYQLLYFRLTELDTNIVNISVSSHNGKLISGKTFIYDKQLSNYDLSIGDYLLKDKPFISNENSYDNIFVNNYNYLVYDNDTTIVDDTTYFLSNLTGQYISNSTYNYMLVTIGLDYIQNSLIKDYLSTDNIFFDFYRLATQSDFDNIQALNNQLVNLNDNYTFLSLFGSIIDAHFNTIKSLINFNFFGINLWSIFTLFLTLTLIFIVFKFLRGGKKE